MAPPEGRTILVGEFLLSAASAVPAAVTLIAVRGVGVLALSLWIFQDLL
ncbi:hypothetical protein ACFXKC_53915 [Streptomyces sp. NPDC059340]